MPTCLLGSSPCSRRKVESMKSPSAASSSIGYLREGRGSGTGGGRVDAVGSSDGFFWTERERTDGESTWSHQGVCICMPGAYIETREAREAGGHMVSHPHAGGVHGPPRASQEIGRRHICTQHLCRWCWQVGAAAGMLQQQHTFAAQLPVPSGGAGTTPPPLTRGTAAPPCCRR